MTPLREQKMKRFFKIYDADLNGQVGKVDFELPIQAAVAFLGHTPGSAEYNEMYGWSMVFWNYLRQHLNKSDADSISTEEFLGAMDDLANDRAALDEIIMGYASFTLKMWDRNGDGMMNEEEFVSVHTAYNVSPDSAREAFGHLDRNGDDQLSHDEITQAIDEYFTSDDPNAIGNWFILD